MKAGRKCRPSCLKVATRLCANKLEANFVSSGAKQAKRMQTNDYIVATRGRQLTTRRLQRERRRRRQISSSSSSSFGGAIKGGGGEIYLFSSLPKIESPSRLEKLNRIPSNGGQASNAGAAGSAWLDLFSAPLPVESNCFGCGVTVVTVVVGAPTPILATPACLPACL